MDDRGQLPTLDSLALCPLSNSDIRLRDAVAFASWARRRWQDFLALGPTAFAPMRSSHQTGSWCGQELEFYAELYANDAFDDLLDFALYIRYTSSIQQDMIRWGSADLNHFYPESADEAIVRALYSWKAVDHIWEGDAAQRVVGAWCVPQAVCWIQFLGYQTALIDQSNEGAEVTAVTREGYLSFFVVDG